MPSLTSKYFDKLREAQKIENDGYNCAKAFHVNILQDLTVDQILKLANQIVLEALAVIETSTSLCLAVGMARYYREYACSKRVAA